MVVVSTTWPVSDSSAATLVAPNAAPVTSPRKFRMVGASEMLGENWYRPPLKLGRPGNAWTPGLPA